MKRWTLAMLFLLGSLAGIAQADYIIIIANLGLVKEKETEADQPQQPGAGMAGRMGPGMGGRPGMGGPQGGGAAAGGRPGAGGMRPGAQQPGGGNAGGAVQPPQAGRGGMPGGGMPGGGMMGGGMMGMMGMRGGGQAGGPQGGMMGMMGAQGGGMGGGMGLQGGMMGMMGMQGGMPGGGAGGEALTESDPFYVMTIVETKESLAPSQLRALRNNRPIEIKHKWGTSTLQPADGIDIIVMKSGDKPYPSVLKRYNDHYQAAHKDGETSVALLLDYDTNPQAGPAKFALEHGLLSQFRSVMDEVGKLDPNNVKFKAFQRMDKALAQPLTKDDSAEWKRRLHLKESQTSEHYVLLYNPSSSVGPDQVKSRLKALEDSYRAFFYWFAFNCDKDGEIAYVPKGQKDAPLLPNHRLVSVLAAEEKEFDRDNRIFDHSTLVADGFTARRENLIVCSSERLDKQFKALNEYCSPKFKLFGEKQLLQPWTLRVSKGRTRREFQIASTLALMVRSLEAESETATVTHEVPRQLLSAIGLSPRNVIPPEWLQFGMGSFFETAKHSPWGGAGGPNWVYLLDYKERASRKMAGKLEKPLDALKAVVTDRYFRESNRGLNEAALSKARTMAWSLTYFLAHRKLVDKDGYGLIRYYRELARMPRDLEFDEDSLLNLFARAFNCLDDKGKPDNAKLTKLAEEWHRFIDLTPLEVEEVVKDLRNRRNELRTSETKPGEKTEKKEEDDKPVTGDK